MTDEEKVRLAGMIRALRDRVVKALDEALDAIVDEFIGPIMHGK